MSDEADRADDQIERQLQTSLSYRKPEGPPPCGHCYNCGEPLHDDRRWCDRECEQDWERLSICH